MTPEQEATNALDNGLPRAGLPMAAQVEYDRLARERASAGPAAAAKTGTNATGGIVKEPETVEQKYLRQTRNATVFVAWAVAAVLALSLVGVILTGVMLSKVVNDLNTGGSANGNCYSQGGTDLSC